MEQYVTPDSRTTCAYTGQPMHWNGHQWVHEPGVCISHVDITSTGAEE